MKRGHTTSIFLLTLILMLPRAILAHDDEHQAKDGHDSSEFYEEGTEGSYSHVASAKYEWSVVSVIIQVLPNA